MFCLDNVRWLIQVPRLYDIYRANNCVENFQQILTNLFQPLFEVTKDPNSHPSLHRYEYVMYSLAARSSGAITELSSGERIQITTDVVFNTQLWFIQQNNIFNIFNHHLNHYLKSRN